MGKIVKLGAVLFVITAVTGMILGGVYTLTLEPIRAAKEHEKTEAMIATLPGATAFETVDIEGGAGAVKEINKGTANGELIGYNFTVTPKGYGGLVEIIAGVTKEGRLMAIKIINHSETPGLGAKAIEESFLSQFRDKRVRNLVVTKSEIANDSEIQAISGATITSKAVAQGVSDALAYFWEHYAHLTDEIPDAVTSATEKKTETQEDANQ